ncbi:MAG: hypothetical protein JRG73_11175 [Deltaproteobacteria bacterium]|nr:hypothetical protein [Deltaproteobacteria bacterium]
MIQVSGRWHFHTIVKELKAVDPTCGVETTFVDVEGIREGSIRVINHDPARENDLRAALDSHDPDAALAEWNAKQNRRAAAEPSIRNIPGWASWTAQEAEDYIEADITDLAGARQVLKAMAKMICYLRDHAGIV